jgi:hypothetical protein
MGENEMGKTSIAYEESGMFKIVFKKTGKKNLVWRPGQGTENINL